MSQCKVYLENYNGTYYPGNEIRGRLECYFNDETCVRGIKIRLKCQEHNEWTGTEEYTDPADQKLKTRFITYSGDHDILYIEQTLFDSGPGSQKMNPGRHAYPFFYVLPDNIPSTFSGPHGSITFKLKGVVDIPMGFDYEDNFLFVVVSPLDFNKMPKDLQEVTTYSDEKTVCCWCCQGGNVSMDVELPKRAFIAGEVMNFKVTISNLSNSNVEDLKARLTKTIIYKVTSPDHEEKKDVEDIISLREHGVGAHGEHTFNLQLAIPEHIVIPNFSQCMLFQVDYELILSCEMPACTMNLSIHIRDIELGHIPWRNTYDQEGSKVVTPGFINSLPSIDGVYPQPLPQNPYPPPGTLPYPSSSIGFTTPGGQPSAPPAPGNQPFGANISFDNSKAWESSVPRPTAPTDPRTDLPPPSYNEVQQSSTKFYPSH